MPSRLQIVFWLDVTLLLSFCALEQVPFTGMIVHEWLGIVLTGMIVAHLLLSWTWIASTTQRLTTGTSHRTRFNYLLNLSLFACTTAVIFSGILISQYAIPALTGREAATTGTSLRWDSIHDSCSDLLVILAAMHLAVNWDWVKAAGRKLLRRQTADMP